MALQDAQRQLVGDASRIAEMRQAAVIAEKTKQVESPGSEQRTKQAQNAQFAEASG